MAERRGGIKRSSWLTFLRRLVVVRTLVRGPASSAELIEAVNQELGDQGYPGEPISALKHDLDALKGEYNCQIRYRRKIGRYVLEDLGALALLDLTDDGMEGLAFLESQFPHGAAMPEYANVRMLLDRLMLMLPPHRQAQHRGRRGAISLQMSSTPSSRINAKVMSTVKRASELRQELEFDYRSNTDDAALLRHRVAPYGIFFSPEGHAYLDATVLEITPMTDHTPLNTSIHYRLDRIEPGSTRILPTILPPERPKPRSYSLRYQLTANAARRRDVTTYFPDTRIDYHDDGSATVTAHVTNLWQTRQTLLRYGANCRVEEPAELVDMFRETAEGLADIYDLQPAGASY